MYFPPIDQTYPLPMKTSNKHRDGHHDQHEDHRQHDEQHHHNQHQMGPQPFPPMNRQMNPQAPQQDVTKIPMLPLLGNLPPDKMAEAVHKAIVGEATAIDFYGRLLNEATTPIQRDLIADARQDEQKHLQAFTKLYVFLTGRMPQYRIQPVEYRTFRDGLLYAMKDELEAHSFYRDMTLSTSDQLVVDTFSFAMNDEIEHATAFSFLYQQAGKN